MVVMTVRMAVSLSLSVADANPANVMMMAGLRRPGIGFVADNLCAVFAQLAVHRRRPFAQRLDLLAKCVEYRWMVSQITRVKDFDSRKEARHGVALVVDAFDEDAGKQKIREYHDAVEAKPGRMAQRCIDARMGDPAKRGFGPAEPHSLP